MYEAVVGLEVHVQLDTRTKLFCRCALVEDEGPNAAVCPVCLGHPGTLPVPNREAIRLAVRAALALGCAVPGRSEFARKQYFYPDLPKGYQISQHLRPLAVGGVVTARVGDEVRTFRLHHLHVEEDAGKLVHRGDWAGADYSRAGTPLAEIVSEPDLRSPEDAEAYLRALHRAMTHAGVTRGDLEKGHVRCDVNVSVRRPGAPLGTRVEIKNVNSFRFVAKAVEGEVARQIAILEAGGRVVQETRGWRETGTVSLRTKEESADYRYIPDPDLPLVHVDEALRAEASRGLPAEPLTAWLLARDDADRAALRDRLGVDDAVVETLRERPALRALVDDAIAAGGEPRAMASWVTGPVARKINAGAPLEASRLEPRHLAELQAEVDAGRLSHALARQVLDRLWEDGGGAADVAARHGFAQVSDDAPLRDAARAAIRQSPDQVAKFKEGNDRVLGYFIGLVMRATGGKADPQRAREVVREELDAV